MVADRRILLVLDDAVDLAQIRPLLPGTGACRAMVSSRWRLTALEGRHLLVLGPLARHEAVGMISEIVGPARVAREPVAADRIVSACGFLPLALRIAAARLAMRPSWPLATLADRLQDERRRLDELTLGQLSVRASFEPSYLALDEDTQRAVRLIAMRGRAELPAGSLSPLLERSEAESDRIIERLVGANLLVPADDPVDGEVAYRLDDLFRIYATERAEAEGSSGSWSTPRLETISNA
jgi:hypothetical protein